MSWETIAAQKREALKASIPEQWVIPADILPPDSQTDVTSFPSKSGWFTERELEITSTPAARLLLNIATGSWSSEEVTRVFCKAAAAAHQLVKLSKSHFITKYTRQKLTALKDQLFIGNPLRQSNHPRPRAGRAPAKDWQDNRSFPWSANFHQR